MPKPVVTLRSLAKEAGVSPMTVSLALKNSHEISAKTGDKIRVLAQKRGYRPDPTIRKLMQHLKSRSETRFKATVCAIIAEDVNLPFTLDNYPNRIRLGMKQRAEELGYATDILNLNDFSSKEQIDRILISRGIEGLVLLPLRYISDLTNRVSWELFSSVLVTSAVQAPKFHSALPNHFANITRSFSELTSLGYTRIGFITLKDWGRRTLHRWESGVAWQNCFTDNPEIKIYSDPISNPSDYGSVVSWLEKNNFEVIIAEPLSQAPYQEIINRLPESKRPKIIAMSWPTPLATAGIDQRPELIGKAAIEILDGLIIRGEKGIPIIPYSTLIDGLWVAGKLPSIRTRHKSIDLISDRARIT